MMSVCVKGLIVHEANVGVDIWERDKQQPILIDITANTEFPKNKDTLVLSYSDLLKVARAVATRKPWKNLLSLAKQTVNDIYSAFPFITTLSLKITQPKALLHAADINIDITRPNPASSSPLHEDVYTINALQLSTIIGINPWERIEKQIVILTIHMHLKPDLDQTDPVSPISPTTYDKAPSFYNYRTIAKTVTTLVEESRYKTVEALCQSVAKCLLFQCNIPKVTVLIQKPSALTYAQAAAIKITRTRGDFADEKMLDEHIDSEFIHTVYVALGSNKGDRAGFITKAIKHFPKDKIRVLDTSFLYETDAMYNTDQPKFLNAVVKIQTNQEAEPLLDILQNIEASLGRQSLQEREKNGPREIDLDILFFDDSVIDTERLIIPHPLIQDREFVLQPLCDIAESLEHPTLYRTPKQLLSFLNLKAQAETETPIETPQTPPTIRKVFPLNSTTPWPWQNGRTLLMGILNTTPDSFSDGSPTYRDLPLILVKVAEMIGAGADVIDVGGQSTRPFADQVPIDEEIARVVPVIKAIRQAYSIPISIDTYRVEVARAALDAGANIVNDVTGGVGFDEDMQVGDMHRLWAEKQCGVCIMHMKGSPKTMTLLTDYEGGDVILEIRRSLGKRVGLALSAGLYRWNVMIDPGIGFAKNTPQNFRIINSLPQIVCPGPCYGFPLLVGPSRKKFIGETVGSGDSRDSSRVWGTAAACTACIAGGANVLRVHDVKEMKDVVRVADECFRQL